MKQLKYILLLVLCFLLLGLAWYAGYKYKWVNKKEEVRANVVLEKVEKVFKLITIEGHLSEIYDYKDYYNWDISLFRKKALVRVNAIVSAGFDFDKVTITTDEATKTLIIKDFPKAEILSMDHDLDYYDITQGSFNTFSSEDYNEINKTVKEYAKSKAIESELLTAAEAQKEEIIDMLKTIIEASGWSVIVENNEKSFLQ